MGFGAGEGSGFNFNRLVGRSLEVRLLHALDLLHGVLGAGELTVGLWWSHRCFAPGYLLNFLLKPSNCQCR
jgi:hypothetical protein